MYSKFMALVGAAICATALALDGQAQSAVSTTQLDDPHKWYWLGHWHLWHGGWRYWWTMPLLVIAVGVAMFCLGRWSVKANRNPGASGIDPIRPS
jgi:hypothetical protein